MNFPSRRDLWLLMLVWFTIAGLALGSAILVWKGAFALHSWVTAGLLLGSAAFLLWIVYGTSYTIEGNVLVIRCGPFRWRVPLDDIVGVSPTDDPSSAPACSLDRLEIRYRSYDTILISPEQREEFVTALRKRCPALAESHDPHPPGS